MLNIFTSFDEEYEVRRIVLDISKALDNVKYDIKIYCLNCLKPIFWAIEGKEVFSMYKYSRGKTSMRGYLKVPKVTYRWYLYVLCNSFFTELNDDLKRTTNWAFQRKMNFNSGPNKQAQEVIFSRKQKQCAATHTFNLYLY